jgi:hypothetical protein
MDKKSLTERDICTKFITPAIKQAGWDEMTQVREQVYFTKGQIKVRGKLVTRGKAKFADYILYYKPNIPLAIIEAKDNNHAVGEGMQQALGYAECLQIPFVFSSNGDGFVFHDRTGRSADIETNLTLDAFPTPAGLWAEYEAWKGIAPSAAPVVLQEYARLLLTMPPQRQVHWSEATVSPATEAAMADVFTKLLSLEAAADEDGKPAPLAMPATPEAKAVWVAYFNRHRAEMTSLDDDLCAAGSKLEAYTARLALIVQLCSWADGDGSAEHVDQSSIEAGIALSDWFGNEARRVYEVLGDDVESAELRQLVDLIQRQGGAITARKLAHCSRAHRGAGDAEAALERLAKAGLGRWAVHTATGGRPAWVFALIGNAGNETPENSGENGHPLPPVDNQPDHEPIHPHDAGSRERGPGGATGPVARST